MASRWGKKGNSKRLYFLGLQNHCRWWLHPWKSKILAPWKKSYDQPRQHIKKQRHYFASEGSSSQSYVWMYGCESWTIKKAEHWRIDAFELWCWRRVLRIPWTARRSNQSIWRISVLNIHWKDWCWSWNSSTLATWCKELTHLKRPWCWERLRAGGEGDDRGWDGWRSEERRVGKEWKQCQTLFFFFGRGGTKITADYGCSHENQRFLLLGRKTVTNLHSILKSRDITLLTKVQIVKAMVFPVVMYGCES